MTVISDAIKYGFKYFFGLGPQFYKQYNNKQLNNKMANAAIDSIQHVGRYAADRADRAADKSVEWVENGSREVKSASYQAAQRVDQYVSNIGSSTEEFGRQIKGLAEKASDRTEKMVQKGSSKVAGWFETTGKKFDQKCGQTGSFLSSQCKRITFVALAATTIGVFSWQNYVTAPLCEKNPLSSHCVTSEFNGYLSGLLSLTLVGVLTAAGLSIAGCCNDSKPVVESDDEEELADMPAEVEENNSTLEQSIDAPDEDEKVFEVKDEASQYESFDEIMSRSSARLNNLNKKIEN